MANRRVRLLESGQWSVVHSGYVAVVVVVCFECELWDESCGRRGQ